MTTLMNVFNRYIAPYKRHILIAVIVIIFIIASYYGYNWYIKGKYISQEGLTDKFSDVANANRRKNTVEIYFFHVDWCPHCKKAKPEWDDFSSKYNKKEVNGYTINCVDVDCTDETDDKVKDTIKSFNLESYPTVKMLKETDQIEYDAKISSSGLEKFVLEVLN